LAYGSGVIWIAFEEGKKEKDAWERLRVVEP
jgi:hypothetical protein